MSFKTGDILFTRGINQRVMKDPDFSSFIMDSFRRYMVRDWGDLCQEDKNMNDSAVKNNDDRILARYNYNDESIYIITEWDHSATTILFVDEY